MCLHGGYHLGQTYYIFSVQKLLFFLQEKTTNEVFFSVHVEPSAAPMNVELKMLNVSAASVRWSPPPVKHQNGVILGYRVRNIYYMAFGVIENV